MLPGAFKQCSRSASVVFRALNPHINRYNCPLSQFIIGTASVLLFSTGVILCDSSPRTSPPTTTASKSSRQDTAEHRLSAQQSRQDQKSYPEDSYTGPILRLKSGFQDLQAKFSEFETPRISPETFGIPPHFREWVEKIRAEISFSEGSISDEIWKESQDPMKNPELNKDARVWIGNRISQEELEFYSKRKEFTRKGLAKYLDVDVDDIDERDIPIIAIAGSGGGYRAMLGTTGYFKAIKDAGLFDCVTYMAGVSGSCWAINTYLTYGERSIEKMITHFKARLGASFTDPSAALPLFTERPTNKYLLRGLVERFKQGYTELGIVDIFGTLVSSRILIPPNELDVRDDWLKLSNQRKYIDDGGEPLPIYTAVRHEIPVKALSKDEKKKETKNDSGLKDHGLAGHNALDILREKHQDIQQPARDESWFQWFELTPYYVGCEELEAWIPTFGLGRRYKDGVNVSRTPELRLPIIIGIVGSAFCATLSHYYAEIRPFLPTSYAIFRSLDELIKQKDQDLIVVHPIQPASIPNFILGLNESLPTTCPESIKTEQEIKLMDGGMSNNIPFYPLLRREVDIVIALDTSADIQTNPWFERTDGYAKRRGIIGWPVGVGWPKDTNPTENVQSLTKAEPATAKDAQSKLTAAKSDPQPDTPDDPITQKYGLGHVNIWVGTIAQQTHPEKSPQSKTMPTHTDDTWQLDSDDGIMLIYLPFLPNEKCPGVVPETTEYMSTWNFEYTPQQVDNVVMLAERNFEVGRERIRRAVRAMWNKKRQTRMEREKEGVWDKEKGLMKDAFKELQN